MKIVRLSLLMAKEMIAHESFVFTTIPASQSTGFKAADTGSAGGIWDCGIKFIYLD